MAGLVGAQTPRIHVVPPYVSSAGKEAIEVAEVAGLQLDPWEKLSLTDALGETAEGRWAAFRIGLEAARQNGKGAIEEARELAGLFAFGERLIIHSAHEQITATEHFVRMLNLMEGVPEFDRRILKVVRGKGSEAIKLRGGYRIFFKTRTGSGGRGLTGDLVVLDEAMELSSATMAALVPTMAARSMIGDPQLWFVGSAVDQEKHEHGVEFARVRADALAGVERLAYFGWNAPFDHPDELTEADLDDRELWAMSNPGLGIRISDEYIADERRTLGAREFAVERLGVGDWPVTDGTGEQVIDLEVWKALKDLRSRIVGLKCFAFDVKPDRSRAAIAVAGLRRDGKSHVEIAEHLLGTDWVEDWIVERVDKHEPVAVVCDEKGPAGSLVPGLEDRGVEIVTVSAGEHAQACGMLFDAVGNGALCHLGTPELEAAVRGAAKRPLGDAWAWSRINSAVDISPLVAVTLAHWGNATQKPKASKPLAAWA